MTEAYEDLTPAACVDAATRTGRMLERLVLGAIPTAEDAETLAAIRRECARNPESPAHQVLLAIADSAARAARARIELAQLQALAARFPPDDPAI